MTSSRTLRIGGIGGSVLALMMIVAFLVDLSIMRASGGAPLLDPGNISAELSRAQRVAIWPVELWLYTLMVIPGSLLAFAAYRLLTTKENDGLAAIGLLLTAFFWIFHTLHNVLMLGIFQAVVPLYATGCPNAAAMEIVTIAILRVAYAMFNFGASVGGLLQVGSLLAFGLVTLRNPTFPRWTGYIGLASSFAILGSSLQFFSDAVSNPFVVLGLLGWILFMIWVVGTSLALLGSSGPLQALGQQYAT